MLQDSIHVPVLLNEVLEVLDPKPGEFFIDGTVNGGGHTFSIVQKMMPNGKYLAVDLDGRILQGTRKMIEEKFQIPNSKFQILWEEGNYADLPKILEEKKLGRADGFLLDLGFSSMQLEARRGFSFRIEKGLSADLEPLDMRYSSESDITAAEIINSFREEELIDIFRNYGEERSARKIAKAILEGRKKERIVSVGQLVRVIDGVVLPKNRKDVLQKIFQSLRIYVNDELNNLKSILENLAKVVKPGGRIAIISFHSLEDRLVKNKFKELVDERMAEILTHKPIEASEEEIKANPKARSAKLRAVKIFLKS
ncbi:MAG TPA: 16S rRNA (cytosine(1402)-N(4))-methyltransferase RsmH [Candidatus Paceibacterota bacterium]